MAASTFAGVLCSRRSSSSNVDSMFDDAWAAGAKASSTKRMTEGGRVLVTSRTVPCRAVFQRLFPPGEPAPAEAILDVPDGPRTLLNMVSSLDGRVTRNGGSTELGAAGDKAMFFALRGIVDGVLAGTGTLREESYGRLAATPERRDARAARGLAPDPTMLVITRSGDVHWDAPLFDCPEQRVHRRRRRRGAVARARARGGRPGRHARGGVRGVPRAGHRAHPVRGRPGPQPRADRGRADRRAVRHARPVAERRRRPAPDQGRGLRPAGAAPG